MALPPSDAQSSVEGAAPADLDHLAERIGIGRLAKDAMIETRAALMREAQQLFGPVDRRALLIAGDEKTDRALSCPMPLDEADRRGGEGRDRAFHIGDAAAVDRALDEFRAERIEAPTRGVSGRHDVGMAGEDDMRRAGSDAGVEILDVGRAGF